MVADPPESWLWRRTRGSTTPNRTIPSGIPQNLTVWLHLDFGIILIWCRLMSRLCIGTRSQADCCANHGTQFFFILPVIPQARNRMQLPRRHASSASQVIVPAPRSGTNFLLAGRGKSMARFSRSLSDAFWPTVRPPDPFMRRQSIYIIIIDICSFRSGLHSQDCNRDWSAESWTHFAPILAQTKLN